MPTDVRPLYAVLIDADNINPDFADAIMTEAAGIGEPALRRVYGDWSNPSIKKWVPKVKELGLVAGQTSANTKGKNATDIGLVIDAMDILHSGRFDGFVLVSSDSDFTALANRIREQGLDVIGIGESKTPSSLRNVCNRFILIENIVAEASPGTAAKKAAATKQPIETAEQLLLDVIDNSDAPDGWIRLSQVGTQILAKHSDFDTRTYGYKKLSDLIKASARIDRKLDGKIIFVRRSAAD